MNIACIAVGTRGDIQPFVALGIALKNTGHRVTIISAKNEEMFVRYNGLDFFAIDINIRQLLRGNELDGMGKGSNPFKFIAGHLKSAGKIKKLMIAAHADIWEGCKNAEMIVYHPGMPIGYFIAQHNQVPAILATPFPIVPTSNYPAILFYRYKKAGRLFNKLTHVLFQKIFWAISKTALKQFWHDKVNTKVNFSTPVVIQHISNKLPVLNAYSRHLFKPDSAWGDHIYITGSWFLREEYSPPAALEDFLKNGSQPVYIGFGSMKGPHDLEATLAIIKAALMETGQRAVLALGWTDAQPGEPLPDNIFLMDSLPHAWLFPKMSMVVHHGGAGTTSAGIAAGKPTVIIPHNADQPAWGKRLFELGVAAKPIPAAKLDAGRLAGAIRFALQPSVINAAKALGAQINAEPGANSAAEIIAWLLPKTKK